MRVRFHSLVPLALLGGCSVLGGGPDVLPDAQAREVRVGNGFACALTTEGAVRCWGWGGDGEEGEYSFFGEASAYRVTVPVEVGDFRGATDLDVAYQHICVVTASTEVVCWGQNHYGELGLPGGHTSGPGAAIPGLVGVTKVAVGSEHSCALLANGKVACWGFNGSGQLGFEPTTAATTASTTPVEVSFIDGATDLWAGSYATCALVGGTARCWGNHTIPGAETTPADIPLAGVDDLYFLPPLNACVVAGGSARCWGEPDDGQLGNNTDFGDEEAVTPVQVTGLDRGVTDLDGRCAVQDGRVRCWGINYRGDGENPREVARTPTTALEITDAVQVSVGGEGVCAVGATGSVWCWGENLHGVVGIGVDAETSDESNEYLTPQKVLSFP